MERAGGGVWPGLEAEPRRPAGRQGPWRDQLSSGPLSFESFLEVAREFLSRKVVFVLVTMGRPTVACSRRQLNHPPESSYVRTFGGF